MSFTKLTANVNNIQALNDRPNANTGLTADQVKAAFDQAGSDIKDYINNTLTPQLDSNSGVNLGIVNVMSYNASGLATTATGSITTGTKALTLTTTPDFAAGQGINLQGAFEVASLQITSPASASANCTVTLDGVAFTVALVSGDTAIQVATKIRAATYTGWTAGGTALSDTVTFTSNTTGTKTDASYTVGTTGATGTMSTMTQGTADQISTVSSISGLIVTIADNSTRTIAAGVIKHNDTFALQTAATTAMSLNSVLYIPAGSYYVTDTWMTATKYIKIIGAGQSTTKIYYSGSTNDFIKLSTAQTFIMEDLALYYVGASTTLYGIIDLATYSGFDIRMSQVLIQDFPYGVKLKKVVFCKLDVGIRAVSKTVYIGLDLATATSDYANAIDIVPNFTSCNIGLRLGNGVNVRLHDKGFQANITSSIQFLANSSGLSSSVEFDNVYFEETLVSVAAIDGLLGRNQILKFTNCYFATKIAAKFSKFKGITFDNCSCVSTTTSTNDFYVENCTDLKVINSNIVLRTYSGTILNQREAIETIGNLARKSHYLGSGSTYWSLGGTTASSVTVDGRACTKIVLAPGDQNISLTNKITLSGGAGLNYFARLPMGVSFDIKASKVVPINGVLQAGAYFVTSVARSVGTEWQHFSFNGVTAQDISSASAIIAGIQIAAYDSLGMDIYIDNFRIWYGQLEEPRTFLKNTDSCSVVNRPNELIVSLITDASGYYFREGDIIRKSVTVRNVLDKVGWVVKQGGAYFGTLAVRANTTAYAVGDVKLYDANATTYVMLCVVAGTSGTLAAVSGEAYMYNDGTVSWWLYYYGTTAVVADYVAIP